MVKRTQTKWKWFAAAAIPSTLIASGLMAGVASGAVPVAINVAGETFKVAADELDGDGFRQYGSVVVTPDGRTIPVAASEIDSADLTNLCQSVTALGMTLQISAGADPDNPAHADNLTIGLEELRGDATFGNIFIGRDASTYAGNEGAEDLAGTIGQDADSVQITRLEQTAYSTHAGTFTLPGLRLRFGEECFPWG